MSQSNEETTASSEPLYKTNLQEAKLRLNLLSVAHGITHVRGALLPLIYPLLVRGMGFGYVELGIMLTVTRLIGGLLQGIWGSVARFFSGKTIIGYENIGVGAGTALVGMATNYPQLVLTVLFGQIAASPHHPIGSSMISQWYGKEKRGSAQAFHFAMANVATIITPLVAGLLLKWFSWQITLYIFSIPAVIVGMIILLRLPSEMVAAKPKDKKKVRFGAGFIAPLKDPLVRRLILTASVTAGGKGLGVVQAFMPLLFIDAMGLSVFSSSMLFTLFAVTSVAGPILAGRLSDRYNRSKFLSFLLWGACALSILMGFLGVTSIYLLIPLMMIFGMFIFGYSPVEQTIMADLTAKELQADAYSLFFSITFAAGALWPVILMSILDVFGFSALFMVIAFSYLAGAIIYMRGNWETADRGAS